MGKVTDLESASKKLAKAKHIDPAIIIGTTLPFLLFNYAAPKLTTKQTALTLNIIPVVAILFGAVLGRGLPVGAQYVVKDIVCQSLFS